MSAPFLLVGSFLARSMRVIVPATGVPVIESDFAQQVASPPGPTIAKLGNLSISCVVDPTQSGDFALSSHLTLVGGRGGWSRTVPPRALHSDAQVKRSDVASQLAAEIGETIVVDASADGAIGVDFIRAAGPASRVLEQLFSGSQWWVGVDGVTHVGTRPRRDVTGRVQIVGELDARLGVATLVAEDPNDVLPGCSFTDQRLSAPFVIHDLDMLVDGTQARATVYSGAQRDGQIADLLTSLARRALPRAAFSCPREYRVATISGDRVNLQYVPDPLEEKPPEIPDSLPISIAPGMAGLSAQLTLGTKVLVEFINANPGRPLVTHFAPKGEPGFLPVSLLLDAATNVNVGDSASSVDVGTKAGATLNVGNGAGSIVHLGSSEPAAALMVGRFLRSGDLVTLGTQTGAINLIGTGSMSTVRSP